MVWVHPAKTTNVLISRAKISVSPHVAFLHVVFNVPNSDHAQLHYLSLSASRPMVRRVITTI
jgi:hypothetical protein